MWIIRCARACHHAVIAHAPVIAIPAAITTIGAATALSMMFAKPTPKPDLACGCHEVWVAPAIPMTPATYAQVMGMAGNIALASIPLANAPGGAVYGTPTNLVPALAGGPSGTLPNGPVHGTVVLTHSGTPTAVPEPASLALFATGLLGLMIGRRALAVRA